jgi:phage terminase large subunit
MIATLKTFAKQRRALRLLRDQQTNEVMYGGGARGGKSWIGNAWILMAAISMPGSAWLVAREELTKLRDTTLLTYFKVANALGAKGEYTFNATSNTATFLNGSVVFFREIKWIPSDPEFDRLGSYDLTGAFIDEAQQIHPKAISVLRGRFSLLTGELGEDGLPLWRTVPKMLFTCNPSKNWIYTDFYKPSVENRLEPHKAFVVSLATDNPFVSQDYLTNLRRSDKVTVARLLDGNFEYDDDPTVLVGYDAISNLLLNDRVATGRNCLTVDVARFGTDSTVIWRWSGFRMVERLALAGQSTQVATEVKRLMKQHRVLASHVVVDDDGVGGGVRDQIPGSVGFVNNSRPLADPQAEKVRNPTTGKLEPPKENYDNLKSQCAFRMAARMAKGEVFIYPEAVELVWDRIAEELAQWKRLKPDSDGKLRLVPKATMKAALGRSPDDADSILMREVLELAPPPPRRSSSGPSTF